MKKIILLFLFIILLSSITVWAQDTPILKAGVSMIDSVPEQFFGTWSVMSSQVSTDSPKTFAKTTMDLWNLRRTHNVIELRNPVTGAVAEIYLEDVTGNEITFTHYEKEGNTYIKESVKLNLNENSFTGTNELNLRTVRRDENGKKIEDKKNAVYSIKGSKLSGSGIF